MYRLHNWYILLFLALSVTTLSWSREKQIAQGPEFTPTRIILGWTGNPGTSLAVTWMTGETVPHPQAQLAVASPNAGFEASAITLPAECIAIPPEEAGYGQHYRVVLKDLEPDTRYVYRVGDGSTWSEWIDFKTAGGPTEPFRFLYFGDAQNKIKSLWSRSVRAAYRTAPDARFMVFAGDILAEGYDDALWEEWWYGMGFISAMIPTLPVAGNHDLHRRPDSPNADRVMSVSPLWNAHFTVPSNGPGTPLDHQSYYFDYQGVRFVFVDVDVYANEDFEPAERDRVSRMQADWLEETLKQNPNLWTIVVQHQPIFAVAKDREYAEMRHILEPLYDRYHVDLVLEGHDHVYARTHKIFEERAVKNSDPGTIYVISVSGPKMYALNRRFESLLSKTQMNTQMYQIVSIDNKKLDFKAFSIDGTLVDDFQIDKHTSQSLLVERNR